MEAFFAWINGIIWSNALIALCLGAGLWFSFRTRFMQVRGFAEMCRLTVTGQKSDAGVSSFQALAISMAGRMGIGNIAGVATAIAYGGPGAVFWMWVMGFLGASTSYIECTLAQIYKEKDAEGRYRGGPAYYIEKAMGLKWYAVAFAVATVVATGLLLPGVQANAIADSASNVLCGAGACEAVGGPGALKLWLGVGVAAVLALIIFGGIKRIATFAEVVVPFMALAFILMAVIVMIANASKVPAMFADIFSSAFGAHAAFGAIIGQAIAWGVKRGIYANEAGQGTGPHAAAAAEVSHPAKQGFVQAFAVYIDTLFVCSATAFIIISTGAYRVYSDGSGSGLLFEGIVSPTASEGPAFVQTGFDAVFSGFGPTFVAVALAFFAFTTIVAYYYMAEVNLVFLTRNLRNGMVRRVVLRFLQALILVSVAYGAVATTGAAWGLGDIGVGSMAWLNILGILVLQGPALKALKDYRAQKRQGLDPQFDPRPLGIRNADFWEHRADGLITQGVAGTAEHPIVTEGGAHRA